MADAKKYSGGCHCGKVKYEVTAELERVMECNCSICSKKGNRLCFVGADQFQLLSGEDDLTDYQFNKHIIHHLFCKSCGIGSFARGKGPKGAEMVAINVRCLEDVDPASLKITQFDGKSL